MKYFPFYILVAVALVITYLDIYPDVEVLYFMKTHGIKLKEVLACHSVSNDNCHSLDKWPEFKVMLQNDKD